MNSEFFRKNFRPFEFLGFEKIDQCENMSVKNPNIQTWYPMSISQSQLNSMGSTNKLKIAFEPRFEYKTQM